MRFGCLVSLRAEVGRCGSTLGEVSREDWLNERAEYDLSTSAIQVSLRETFLLWTRRLTQSEGEPSTIPNRI